MGTQEECVFFGSPVVEPARHLEIELANSTDAPKRARRALASWAADILDVESLRDVLLMASELVTNAVVHTDGRIVLNAWVSETLHWRIEVSDESTRQPRVHPELLKNAVSGGRGLSIVQSLATSWGSTPRSGGKKVWFELRPTRLFANR